MIKTAIFALNSKLALQIALIGSSTVATVVLPPAEPAVYGAAGGIIGFLVALVGMTTSISASGNMAVEVMKAFIGMIIGTIIAYFIGIPTADFIQNFFEGLVGDNLEDAQHLIEFFYGLLSGAVLQSAIPAISTRVSKEIESRGFKDD